MKKFLLPVAIVILLSGAIFIWQLPTILRAIPSRYVVRLPEPLQEIGVREHVDALPTAENPVDVSALLPPTATATIPAPPPTPTPLSTSTPESPTDVSTATEISEITAASQSVASPTPLAPTPTLAPTITLAPTATPIPFESEARLLGIAHQFQEWNNCGPATLAMGLSYFQLYLAQTTTASWLKPNPEDRNVSPHEMAAYVNEQTDFAAVDRANGNLDMVRQFLSHNMPVIIETGIDPPGDFAWMDWYGHYYLVVAYDDAAETFWVYDSWLGTGEDQTQEQITSGVGRPISYADFDRYWRQFNRNYIVIYEQNEQPLVDEIIGPALDDTVMWEQTLARLQVELEAEPENPYLWFNLGTIYNGLRDYERAATAFDQARALRLPWRMLWYQFGPYEAYYQIGRYEDVIELADVTLHQRPYFEESFYYRGLAYQALGDNAQAAADLNRAADFNPRFEPALVALADLER